MVQDQACSISLTLENWAITAHVAGIKHKASLICLLLKLLEVLELLLLLHQLLEVLLLLELLLLGLMRLRLLVRLLQLLLLLLMLGLMLELGGVHFPALNGVQQLLLAPYKVLIGEAPAACKDMVSCRACKHRKITHRSGSVFLNP